MPDDQIARVERHDGWTRAAQVSFLVTLAGGGAVAESARAQALALAPQPRRSAAQESSKVESTVKNPAVSSSQASAFMSRV